MASPTHLDQHLYHCLNVPLVYWFIPLPLSENVLKLCLVSPYLSHSVPNDSGKGQISTPLPLSKTSYSLLYHFPHMWFLVGTFDQGTSHPTAAGPCCHLSARQLMSSHLVSKFKLSRMWVQNRAGCERYSWVLSSILWQINLPSHLILTGDQRVSETGVVFFP